MYSDGKPDGCVAEAVLFPMVVVVVSGWVDVRLDKMAGGESGAEENGASCSSEEERWLVTAEAFEVRASEVEASGDDGKGRVPSEVKSVELLDGDDKILDCEREELDGVLGVESIGSEIALEGDRDGEEGVLGLNDEGSGDAELAGAGVDVGTTVVSDGTADVDDNTALSATGRWRTIVVAAATLDRYVVDPRVEVSGSAVLPTIGSHALAPIGWPSC